MRRALIVVAKKPEPGRTKTRLTPPLSPQQAADFYRCLMLDTFRLMDSIANVQPVIAFAPEQAEGFFAQVAPVRFRLVPQRGADLGQRLDHVLRTLLSDGFDQAVVMNSDGPTLPVSYLAEAFAQLNHPEVDVVLGPSEDGGYYLIGLKQPCTSLFDVTMSTANVLEDTLARARAAERTVACLLPWYDVDVWADILRIADDLAHLPEDTAPHTRAFVQALDLSGCQQT